MNTKEVESVLGRKFKKGQSLQEQTTEEEYAKISFLSVIDTDIIVAKSMINRTESDKEIEDRINTYNQKVLEECNGDYKKALNIIS